MNELTSDERRELVDAIHDSATVIHKGQMMNEKLGKMWADPRFQLLADLDRVFDSNKVWGGMEWVYHPIHPAKYRPMAERIRTELRNLYTEYGVEE